MKAVKFFFILFILIFIPINVFCMNSKKYKLQTNYYLSFITGKDNNHIQYLVTVANGFFVVYSFDTHGALIKGERKKIKSDYNYNSVLESNILLEEFKSFATKHINKLDQIEILEFYDSELKNGITDYPYPVLNSPGADFSLDIKNEMKKNNLFTLWLNGYDNIMTGDGLFIGVDYFLMSSLEEKMILNVLKYAYSNYLDLILIFEKYPYVNKGVKLEITIDVPSKESLKTLIAPLLLKKEYKIFNQKGIYKLFPVFDKSLIIKEILDTHLFVRSINGKIIDYNFSKMDR